MKDAKEVSELKIIVFGEPAVGKSALTIRYTKQKFEDIYEPTIEDTYPANVELDGRSVELSVVDTAGHGVFSQMRESYIKSGDGFLLVYSVTDKESFEAISGIREQILSVKGEKGKIHTNTAMVLVGNKCDLDDERHISYQEGDRLARQFSCPFFETSAKDDNVYKVWSVCLWLISHDLSCHHRLVMRFIERIGLYQALEHDRQCLPVTVG